MASTRRLKMVYNTGDGSTVTHTYNYAQSEVTSTMTSTLAQATITNAALFAREPVSLKSAELVVTTTTDLTPAA